ncbi:MAG TPA: hypothetical protein VK968_09575, partial [Roseimicrobium sp.]|nr:hypothetical protein [Roseimicrobium sp.]
MMPFSNVLTDISLKDEDLHYDDFPSGEDLWHESHWNIIGESEGYDFMLLRRMVIRRVYNPKGQWTDPGDNFDHETTLVMRPSSLRGKAMEDHDFIQTGHYFTQAHPLSDLEVTATDREVTWAAHGCTYVSRPPVWELKGTHGGVTLDLTIRQMPPAWWILGPWQDAMKMNRGGYDAPCSVEGTITVHGRSFTLQNGYGIREHMATGSKMNVIAGIPQSQRMYWDWLVSKDYSIFFFTHSLYVHMGIVRAFGEDFLFDAKAGKGKIKHTVLENWNDPRSGLALPTRRHLAMASDRGVLDIEISAHGRSYMHWVMTEGLRVEIYQIGVANGEFVTTDGRS